MIILLLITLIVALAILAWLLRDTIHCYHDSMRDMARNNVEQQVRHLEHVKEMQEQIQSMMETYIRCTGGTYIPQGKIESREGVPTKKWGQTKINTPIVKGSIIP